MFFCKTKTFNLLSESPQKQGAEAENERLLAEIERLKRLLGSSQDGAIGGADTTHFIITEESRIEKLENELRIAKELIQSKLV